MCALIKFRFDELIKEDVFLIGSFFLIVIQI